MTMNEDLIYLSDIDEKRFSIKTAKAADIRMDNISAIMQSCADQEVVLLIARCPTYDLKTVQKMEQLGFLLMDTIIYFNYDLLSKPMVEDIDCIHIRTVRAGEENAVRSVAQEAFKGYLGHYHADNRLDRDRCDEVYMDWAYRSCISSETADVVLVSEHGGKIVGFGTIRINNPMEGEGMLFGVAPPCQGKGVYRGIMKGCINWCTKKGLHRMIISTQITNVASQKVWSRLGFEPNGSLYTFHKWFIS